MGQENQLELLEKVNRENPLDLLTEEDLEMWISGGFVFTGSLASFAKLRELMNLYLDDKPDEKLVFSTASAPKLFLVKEKDYEYLKKNKWG